LAGHRQVFHQFTGLHQAGRSRSQVQWGRCLASDLYQGSHTVEIGSVTATRWQPSQTNAKLTREQRIRCETCRLKY
jgi:hypothetical protein